MAQVAPYGTWVSPISAADVARAGAGLAWVGLVGDEVWWAETRPEEAGRTALVRRRPDGRVEDVLPAGWSVRNRVLEYGGRPWLAVRDGDALTVVFTHWADQRVYRYAPDLPGGEPYPLSPEPATPAGFRYADFTLAPSGDEVWCVREAMTGPSLTDVRREIVALPLDGRAAEDPAAVRVLAASHHFMTGPKLSPDGRHVAWIGWDHPAMPWDGTELVVAPVGTEGTAGTVGPPRVVAGGPREAVAQAEWADTETLYALTDPDGWWNVHRVAADGTGSVNLCPREEEFGGALWRVGLRWLAPLGDGRLAVVHGTHAMRLGVLDPATGELTEVGAPYTEWAPALDAAGTRIVGVAASPRHHHTVVLVDLATGAVEALREEAGLPDPGYLPEPEPRVFTGPGGREVYANVYPPRNADFTAPEGELPPYVVFAHGGPTSRNGMVLDLGIAYFTSRGIGVVDVQYGGSTGYGRAYRERLRGNWGVVDVEDCAAAARGLVEAGLADPGRIGIRGGSAGGWTAAASLTSVDLYRCGAIYYPILDLVGWRTGETHDFESRYLDSLVGPWPETRDRYVARSPVNRADRLRAPFILFQGLEDVICPPEQCERFLEVVAGRGIPHAYLAFEGEQHGFRKAETIIRCLEAELSLYGRAFGFEPPGVPPVEPR